MVKPARVVGKRMGIRESVGRDHRFHFGWVFLVSTQATLHAMFIGLVVFVIASLDRPLGGPLVIDSHPYQLVLDRLIDLK